MKTLLRVGAALALVLLALAGAAASWLVHWSDTPTTSAAFSWEVSPGATLRGTLREMHAAGRVRGSWEWEVAARARGWSCIEAGVHPIRAGLRPAELVRALCHALPPTTVRVTIPEGSNVWQVAERLQAAGLATDEDLAALATDPALAASLGVPGPGLEGWLFPDTYEFYVDASGEALLGRMVARAHAVHAEVLGPDDAAPTPRGPDGSPVPGAEDLSRLELVTLASLVEKEARVAEERPRIARVFYNRLHTGMRLQTDPTCVYGPETWHEIPSRSRCRDPESRWSTYVIDGLPPGPIASPGRAALEATLAPSDEAELLYFVALPDGSGRHAFSTTYEEHRRHVARWRDR